MNQEHIKLIEIAVRKNNFPKEQVREVYFYLLALGAGEELAQKVIFSKKYWEKFHTLKKQGANDLKILKELEVKNQEGVRLTTSLVVSLLVLIIGVVFHQPYLWLPSSVLLASVINLFTHDWVLSQKLGSAKEMGMFIKALFALVGLYAMIGQFILGGLLVWWFVF